MVQDSRISVKFSSKACIFAAVILLAVPFPWFVAWMIAAVWHELCHCFALMLCGKKIECIDIHVHGAQIQAATLSPTEMFFCALAGPMGGLLLFFLCQSFPAVALCALLQTVFNLLPIFPLDGGRAMQAFLQMVLPEPWMKAVGSVMEILILCALTIVGILSAFVWNLGILPLLLSTTLAIRSKNRKTPCK